MTGTKRIFNITFWGLILVISYFAFTPLYVPELDVGFADKINHIGAFAVLFYTAFKGHRINMLKLALYLLFYGFFIEFVQYFLPFRTFSVADLAADAIGIVIGLLFLNLFHKQHQ